MSETKATIQDERRAASHGNDLQRLGYARGSLLALSAHIASAGLASGSQFILARLLGADSYGDYAYVLAWASVLAYLAALGFDVALLRFIPFYESKGERGLANGVIHYAQSRALAAGAMISLFGIAYVWFGSTGMKPQLRDTFVIGFLVAPVWSLLWILCSVSRASGGVLWALVPDRITRESVLVLIILVGAVMRLDIGSTGAMLATLAGSLAGLVIARFAVRSLREKEPGETIAYDAPYWRRSILPLVILGAVEVLMNRTGIVCLGYLNSDREAGVYGLVFNIAFVVTLPRTAVNTLFAPRLAALHAVGDVAALKSLVAKSTRWMLRFSFVIAVAILALADPVLAWFGESFEVGAPALKILAIAQLAVVACGSQINILTMTGHEAIAAKLLSACVAGNLLLTTALIQIWGLTGAAIATGTIFLIWNAAMSVFIWRRLGFMPGLLEVLFERRSATDEPNRKEPAAASCASALSARTNSSER